jgi:hypothetical protein
MGFRSPLKNSQPGRNRQSFSTGSSARGSDVEAGHVVFSPSRGSYQKNLFLDLILIPVFNYA